MLIMMKRIPNMTTITTGHMEGGGGVHSKINGCIAPFFPSSPGLGPRRPPHPSHSVCPEGFLSPIREVTENLLSLSLCLSLSVSLATKTYDGYDSVG